jgi:hypothetical protein
MARGPAGFVPRHARCVILAARSAVDPRTAMPNMNVTEAHAHDIVAYLYRLK